MEKSKGTENNEPIAEAIRFVGCVILALGLIAAGFYADGHAINPTLFWYGAAVVISLGILDRIW